jgi:cobalamin biosynthesis protein CobT
MKAAHLIPKMEAVISKYCNASDIATMHDAVVEMHEYLTEWLSSNGGTVAELDRHGGMNWDEQRSKGDLPPIPVTPDNDGDADKSEDPGNSGGNPGSDNAQTDESGKSDDGSKTGDEDEQGDQSTKSDSTVKSAGTEAGERSIPDQLRDLINENIASTNIAEVNEVMSEINTNRGMMAIRDDSIRAMSDSEIQSSQEVRNRMLDVLDRLIVQVDPSWVFYQEDGIIDPTAYLTREPGDMNFWSGMNGDKGNGHDLSVSLLIDASGSMANAIETVSIIAMGIRKACEHYDIPCTITTFCDQTRLVVAGDEECGFVKVEAGGGTAIFDSMTILDDQVYGNNNHLVVILTDGEWSDLKDVRIWGTPTRHIMIVGYGVDHEMITNKGANSAITISDINELAPLVTNSLAGYFAG